MADTAEADDPLWYDRVGPDEPPGLVLNACAAAIFALVDAGARSLGTIRWFAASLLEVDEPF